MSVTENLMTVTSMRSALIHLDHTSVLAIWDILAVGSRLTAVSLINFIEHLLKQKSFSYGLLVSIACKDGDVLLMNGSVPSFGQREGRVEVCKNNIYGSVCDDFWDRLDGDVVCRQLNFTAGMFEELIRLLS